ncbi:MAG TPA: hypothetical protein VGR95_00995 [Thermoanaerobaculia bacterium]|jgi:hypothetical protein|nr:hypothetical protein [Thermoanaerobaculia bacterium]
MKVPSRFLSPAPAATAPCSPPPAGSTRPAVVVLGGFQEHEREFHEQQREIHVVAREIYVVTREIHVVTREIHVVTRDFHVVTREIHVVARGFHVRAREIDLALESAHVEQPCKRIHRRAGA